VLSHTISPAADFITVTKVKGAIPKFTVTWDKYGVVLPNPATYTITLTSKVTTAATTYSQNIVITLKVTVPTCADAYEKDRKIIVPLSQTFKYTVWDPT
jgi:hypothetical protein